LPPVHALPHAPQSALSEVRSTHPPEQADRPAVHVLAQVPEVQSEFAPLHALPHLPQLAALVVKSTHVPLHAVVPAGQTHVPTPAVGAAQNVPPVHFAPHAPQLALSEVRSTHAPLQFVVPVPQPAEPHELFEHVCVLEQALPHAPQLFGSVAVVTQATPPSEQDIWPAAQVQLDATQVLPPPHVVPHWPQLFGSVPSETQFPLQLVRPGPQPPSAVAASASPDAFASASPVALPSSDAVASAAAPDRESCIIVASVPPSTGRPSTAESAEREASPPAPPAPLESSPPHPAAPATSAHPVSTTATQLHKDTGERISPPPRVRPLEAARSRGRRVPKQGARHGNRSTGAIAL
jgi:hypothetical protein